MPKVTHPAPRLLPFGLNTVRPINPRTSNLPREHRERFRVFPTAGRPDCYTLLFPCSYRTRYGFYDVLGEGIPFEVALLVLRGVGAMLEAPEEINRHDCMPPRAELALAGADVWGRRSDTWWHGLASEESVEVGNLE